MTVDEEKRPGFFSRRPHIVPCLAALTMLVIVLVADIDDSSYPGHLNKSFYQLAPWIVCAGFAFGCWQAHKLQRRGTMWIAALMAIMFNPIKPIGKSEFYNRWGCLNDRGILLYLVSAVVLTWIIVRLKRPDDTVDS